MRMPFTYELYVGGHWAATLSCIAEYAGIDGELSVSTVYAVLGGHDDEAEVELWRLHDPLAAELWKKLHRHTSDPQFLCDLLEHWQDHCAPPVREWDRAS